MSVKILGALALGFIYQFYYSGGDTYNYHTHGSRIVWEAFFDSPDSGLKLLFSNGQDETGIYRYSSKIPFFKDPSSFTVVRFASFFDLITFSAYSATALLFGVLSFIEVSPSYTFQDAGNFDVELTATNSQHCQDTYRMAISTLDPLPNAEVDDKSFCKYRRHLQIDYYY